MTPVQAIRVLLVNERHGKGSGDANAGEIDQGGRYAGESSGDENVCSKFNVVSVILNDIGGCIPE